MRRILVVAALGLVLAFVAQGLVLTLGNAPTYDEAMHIAAGASYLARRDFRIEPENPPLAKALLAAAPLYGYRLNEGSDFGLINPDGADRGLCDSTATVSTPKPEP